jgi:anti-sigma regulatory factor (Ser/Thr protein kinase)
MRKTRSFSGDPRSAAAARRFALDALEGAAPDAMQAIELMVSELATNCIRHAGREFDLSIAHTPDEIRVEVTDRAEGVPMKRSPGLEDPTGRGLQIVELLSEDWGVDLAPGGGKTVWFTVPAASVETAGAGRN